MPNLYHVIFTLLIRLISGTENALYYSKKPIAPGFTILLIIAIFAWSICLPIWVSLVTLIPCAFAFLCGQAFMEGENKKIHLYETLSTGLWTYIAALCTNADWIALFCSSIFGNALFNMPIQYGATGKFINKVSITNDPTGKTWNFYLGNKEYKVRRITSNGYTYTFIGLGLMVLWFYLEYFTQVRFNRWNVLNLFL